MKRPEYATWRPMTAGDLPAVVAIADTVHVDYPERPAVFAERLALFPAGCRIAEVDGLIAGYAVTHPGRLGHPPGLDTLLGSLPDSADCLYLHDVALRDAARGRGLGRTFLELAFGLAEDHHLPVLALIATPGAVTYWRGLGFTDFPRQPDLSAYGEGLAYLTMPASAAPGSV